jgi:acetyl esterase/lipase
MLSPWFPGKRRVGDYPIGKDTPPAFIATAKDDTGAPTSWAESISAAFEKAGVPQFLFQIEKGNHGAFDTSKPDAEVSHWRTLFMEWLGKTLPESSKNPQR